MTALLRTAAVLCTAAGLLCSGLVLLRTREARLALGVLLEYLLAAGLLRLAADPDARGLAAAALLVALRRLLIAGLRRAEAARAA